MTEFEILRTWLSSILQVDTILLIKCYVKNRMDLAAACFRLIRVANEEVKPFENLLEAKVSRARFCWKMPMGLSCSMSF